MNQLIIALMITLVVLSSAARGAVFCANDTAELQQSLATAAANGEDDEIRIRRGSYFVPVGGFQYDSSESFDLEISGGWGGQLNSCNFNEGTHPFQTTLDGGSSERVLYVQPGLDGRVTVSNLLFANGTKSFGAGLAIARDTGVYEGDVLVERTVFVGNTALGPSGGALGISAGDQVRVRNNLFTANDGLHAVSLINTDSSEVYFTNNTVVGNTNVTGDAGVRISYVFRPPRLLANNILWGNDGMDLSFPDPLGTLFLLNNNIEEANIDVGALGTGNVSVDPQFEGGVMNYDLAAASPLKNAGVEPPTITSIPTPFEDNWSVGLLDLAGADRIRGTAIDIGAYEAKPELVFSNGFEN
ncbi:MAG: hypothetical protein QNJ40_25755 [Xanthomonadales bacterium]|nr:hypothetical protein [Xanthomonadales bacterium]